MSRTLALASGLLALACLAGCTKGPAELPREKWLPFTTANDDFLVEFPAQPRTETVEVPTAFGDLEVATAMAEVGRNRGYVFSHLTYPIDPAQYDVATGLDGAVKGVLEKTSGSVLNERDITYGELAGKELLLQMTGSRTYCRTRILIDADGPTLYQLQAIGPREFVNADRATEFFNTLAFPELANAPAPTP